MANTPGLRDLIAPWRSYVAEFLGTFFFVLIANWVVLSASLYGEVSSLEVVLAVGFAYLALLFTTIHIAGGFLNPAVTISMWLAKKISGSRACFFLIAQILASFLAAEVLFLVFGQNAVQFHFGQGAFGLGVSTQTAFIAEAVLTGGLIFTIFGTMVDRNGPVSFGPLAVGLYLAAVGIVALPISGAVFNPARVLGPSLLSHESTNLVVFVVSSLVGSLIGPAYEFVFLQKSKKK